MRGKLRDKRETKHDQSKRESLKRETVGRRASKRDNRNLHLSHLVNANDDEYLLEEEGELTITQEQKN